MNKTIKLLLTLVIFSSLSLQAQKFSFVSCNILSQYPYKTWSKVETMNLEARIAIIKQAFEENGPLQKDIICLQECNSSSDEEYTTIKETLKKQNYQIIDSTTVPNLRKTNKGISAKHFMATVIAYKKDIFEFDNPNNPNPYTFPLNSVTGTANTKGHKNIASVTLKIKKLKNSPSIKIQSWHIPPDEKAEDHHATIKKLLNHCNVEGYTIFCGDFNYNSLTKNYNKLPLSTDTYTMNPNKNQKALEKVMNEGLRKKIQKPTAIFIDAGKQHANNNVPTGYHHGFTRLDYIFYTPQLAQKAQQKLQLNCTDYTFYPKKLTKLIKLQKPKNKTIEGELFYTDPTTGYFSDHAAIIAEFELLDTSTIENLASSLKQLAG